MSTHIRSVNVSGVFQAVVLCVCLAASSAAQADDNPLVANLAKGPAANGTANSGAEPAATDDAVSAWLDEAVPEPKESGRLVRRPVVREDAASGQRAPIAGDTGTGRFELMWPLLVVLALIGGAVFLFRKFMPRSNRLGGGGAICVLSSHYLSSKQSLCLVRLGRRVVLVGVTPERISAVMEISDPVEMAEIVATVERKKDGSFTSALARFGARGSDKESSREPVEDDSWVPVERMARAGSDVRNLVDRIRALSGPRTSAEPT